MHIKKRPFQIFALTLMTIAATQLGCGQSEAPKNRGIEYGDSLGLVPDTRPVPEARWVDATVPRGTPIKVSLIDTLTSQTSHKGDVFRALVTEAIIIDGTVTVPSGSNVRGIVSDVVLAETGFKGQGGMLALDFNSIATPTGATAPLKARLTELGPRKSSAVLAAGAVPGTFAAGAPGREAVLRSNTTMTLVLEEPLRIKVKQ
jgi:hypothetical protein